MCDPMKTGISSVSREVILLLHIDSLDKLVVLSMGVYVHCYSSKAAKQ